ncbi:MAG: DJ-1/PfpI family protein [Acidiferrobacterales bacterium]
MSKNGTPEKEVSIGMLVYPRMTLLDLAGPYEVLARSPNVRIYLVAQTQGPVKTELGMVILPDTTFITAPDIDVLFVPGGPGQVAVMENPEFISFIRDRGNKARLVTSVCTGSLLLAAAGLLNGRRATSHWLSLELLSAFGAQPVPERVVTDGNRITAAGVSAGIDLALTIVALIIDKDAAKEIQLVIEYDPEPPFRSGSTRNAEVETIRRVRDARHDFQILRREQVERISAATRQTAP